MTATAKLTSVAPQGPLVKANPNAPAFIALDRARLGIAAGVAFGALALSSDTELPLPEMKAGTDYVIAVLVDDGLAVLPADSTLLPEGTGYTVIGGFHFAPGGNATARAGGDDVPAINPFSVWDLNYRPACPDPRGMTCVELAGGARVWVDIYLLGLKPFAGGTSRFGVTIADGNDRPVGRDDRDMKALDWRTAREIYQALGKDLLSPEEFFAAAFGVTEGTSAGSDPRATKLDAPRTSRWGLMQATGNMSTWGNDGDPSGPRLAAIFGGSWDDDVWAGSRRASVGHWDGSSSVWLSARGRSDHLQPA